MEWIEITGSSTEEAKEQALGFLGVHESDAEFEVLSEGKTGLFGRLKEEARVRARVVPTTVRPKESRSRGQSTRRSSRRSSSPSRVQASGGPNDASDKPSHQRAVSAKKDTRKTSGSSLAADPAGAGAPGETKKAEKEIKQNMDTSYGGPSLLEQADIAESFVSGVASTLGVSVNFVRHDFEDGILRIEAVGDGIGLLVGRRGATAQAIDELVRTVLQRSGGSIREGKIRMDIGGVRARRAASLADFARDVAAQALESGEAIALEPMNRLDRKIVHDVIADISNVGSRSEGEDPSRRVLIMPVDD